MKWQHFLFLPQRKVQNRQHTTLSSPSSLWHLLQGRWGNVHVVSLHHLGLWDRQHGGGAQQGLSSEMVTILIYDWGYFWGIMWQWRYGWRYLSPPSHPPHFSLSSSSFYEERTGVRNRDGFPWGDQGGGGEGERAAQWLEVRLFISCQLGITKFGLFSLLHDSSIIFMTNLNIMCEPSGW